MAMGSIGRRFYGRDDGKSKLVFRMTREGECFRCLGDGEHKYQRGLIIRLVFLSLPETDIPYEVYPLLFIVFCATTGAIAFSFRHTFSKVKNVSWKML
jgi:hypothetical protein